MSGKNFQGFDLDYYLILDNQIQALPLDPKFLIHDIDG